MESLRSRILLVVRVIVTCGVLAYADIIPDVLVIFVWSWSFSIIIFHKTLFSCRIFPPSKEKNPLNWTHLLQTLRRAMAIISEFSRQISLHCRHVFCWCFVPQSLRQPRVSCTESEPRLLSTPPVLASSPSSVLGQLLLSTSLSATSAEPTSPHSATSALGSVGAWMPTARRSPTPALALAVPRCVSPLL